MTQAHSASSTKPTDRPIGSFFGPLHFEVLPNLLPETTLFLHGNLASNRWWQPLQGVLRQTSGAAAARGSMIMVEFTGCGLSRDPLSTEDLSMFRLAEQIIGMVRQLRINRPIHLVGHSTGGLVAGILLAQAPELFSRAILLDPVGAKGVRFDESMIGAFEAMKSDRELVATVLGSTIHQNDPKTSFFQEVIVPDAFRAVQKAGLMVLQNLDSLDVGSLLSKVPHPVLVLHGEHDLLLPQADSEALAKLLPKGLFQVVPGQGHCTNVENPGRLLNYMNEFLFVS